MEPNENETPPPSQPPPTVGRIVHYAPPQECRGSETLDFYAGMVVRVHNATCVDLVTFGPNSIYHNHSVCFAHGPAADRWWWPPRA
jgi:hypothetical protein